MVAAPTGTHTTLEPSTLTTISRLEIIINQVHAMQQSDANTTGTQIKLTTVQLMRRRSSVSYSQRGSDTKRCGTPTQSNRFTLHC